MEDLPVRKKIRLDGYDYSQESAYFITICAKTMENIFCRSEYTNLNSIGSPIHSLGLSDIGEIVNKSIKNIPQYYQNVCVDKYVIMPNHIHIILRIIDDKKNGRTLFAPTISRVVKHMKEYVTKQIGFSIWQKSYNDHIIRSETAYQNIWNYIDNNPQKWAEDRYYKDFKGANI